MYAACGERINVAAAVRLPPIVPGELTLPQGEFAIVWLNAGGTRVHRETIAMRLVVGDLVGPDQIQRIGFACKTENKDEDDERVDLSIPVDELLAGAVINLTCAVLRADGERRYELLASTDGGWTSRNLPEGFVPDVGSGGGALELGNNRRTTSRRTPAPFRWELLRLQAITRR